MRMPSPFKKPMVVLKTVTATTIDSTCLTLANKGNFK